MSNIKIIPCLDFKDGRVVKGVEFVALADAGDAVQCAIAYEAAGADELTFLDIAATTENRATVVDMVRRITAKISIPLSVGGGIRSTLDARAILEAGAAKIGVNSAAIVRPQLINELAAEFGSKRVIAAIDASLVGESYHVFRNGGMLDTGIDVISWAKEVETRGAGEILLTSINRDGAKTGYDIELTQAVTRAVKIPVTASGGAGKLQDFVDAVLVGGASSLLAASLFHFNILTVGQIKQFLRQNGINVRI